MLLLNYTPVLSQPTGIGVYANSVLPAFDQFEYTLIPGGGSGGGTERLRRLVWSQLHLPTLARERNADLIFTPAPEGYLGEQIVPQVVMVHDLRPLSHPERSTQSLYFRNWVPPLLRQCKHIITNSKFTASEICVTTGLSEDKISVTPLGYDSEHFCLSDTDTCLHDRPYLLHIGQQYPHKNLKRLILAFNLLPLRYRDLDLLLFGKPHPTETPILKSLVLELGLSDRVLFKSYVSYEELPYWYQGAVAFVYPSLWEGFGLPILEAMGCGCPVITSRGSGTEELASSAAYIINPESIEEICDSIIYMLENNRSPYVKEGIKLASLFSWRNTQIETACVVKSVLSSLC